MTFLTLLYTYLMGEENVRYDYAADLGKSHEVLARSSWNSFWDRVYMQEVRNTGEHPEMYVVRYSEMEAAIIIGDTEFVVVDAAGFDHHVKTWENVYGRLDLCLDPARGMSVETA